MKKITLPFHKSLAVVTAMLLLGCSDQGPVVPNRPLGIAVQNGTALALSTEQAIVALRRATARYHNLNLAIADGFVLLHPCEVRPGEGVVGAVYVNFARLLDGVIDADRPDALIYEETRNEGSKLLGAEFAIPYALWTDNAPPAFVGNAFQREDEFGVFALHAWIWRANPNGMFAEANPSVSCISE
jgi:hypothetical protein